MLKGLVIEQLKVRYLRQYSEVLLNRDSEPDIILSNHGLKIAAICVETDKTLLEERVSKWKSILEQGLKLLLVVPARSKTKVANLLWDAGMMTQVSVGTYEINISTPL